MDTIAQQPARYRVYFPAENGLQYNGAWDGVLPDLRVQFGPDAVILPPNETPEDILYYDAKDGQPVKPSAKVLAERKKAAGYAVEIEQARARVTKAQEELDATDYQQAKWLDGDVSEDDYAPIKAQRAELRKEIRGLRAKYPELDPETGK